MQLNIFAPKKSTIKLNDALALKEDIQNKLKNIHQIMRLENSVNKGQKRNYDIPKLVKDSATLQKQLITLKLLIQKANLAIPEGEKDCISYYVYLLSEKKTGIANLQSLLSTAFEGKGRVNGKDVTLDKPVYSRPVLEDWINDLTKECREIEKTLTKLNELITVELPFKPLLK